MSWLDNTNKNVCFYAMSRKVLSHSLTEDILQQKIKVIILYISSLNETAKRIGIVIYLTLNAKCQQISANYLCPELSIPPPHTHKLYLKPSCLSMHCRASKSVFLATIVLLFTLDAIETHPNVSTTFNLHYSEISKIKKRIWYLKDNKMPKRFFFWLDLSKFHLKFINDVFFPFLTSLWHKNLIDRNYNFIDDSAVFLHLVVCFCH